MNVVVVENKIRSMVWEDIKEPLRTKITFSKDNQ